MVFPINMSEVDDFDAIDVLGGLSKGNLILIKDTLISDQMPVLPFSNVYKNNVAVSNDDEFNTSTTIKLSIGPLLYVTINLYEVTPDLNLLALHLLTSPEITECNLISVNVRMFSYILNLQKEGFAVEALNNNDEGVLIFRIVKMDQKKLSFETEDLTLKMLSLLNLSVNCSDVEFEKYLYVSISCLPKIKGNKNQSITCRFFGVISVCLFKCSFCITDVWLPSVIKN
jgi:hypothetical protein